MKPKEMITHLWTTHSPPHMKGIDARAQINHIELLQYLLLSPESKQLDSAVHLTFPFARLKAQAHHAAHPGPRLPVSGAPGSLQDAEEQRSLFRLGPFSV